MGSSPRRPTATVFAAADADKEVSMSDIKIVEEYDRQVLVVWKAMTDPDLVPLWTSIGQGGRPEDFRVEVGAKFRFVGKPFPGWDGIVRCEVLVAEEPNHLSCTIAA
jgi:uncharacterized protein YndB with AHSA1/START domain